MNKLNSTLLKQGTEKMFPTCSSNAAQYDSLNRISPFNTWNFVSWTVFRYFELIQFSLSFLYKVYQKLASESLNQLIAVQLWFRLVVKRI